MGTVSTRIVVVQPHLLLLRYSVEASSQVERHHKKDHRDARHDRVGFCPRDGRLVVWKGGGIEFGGTRGNGDGVGGVTHSLVCQKQYTMRVRRMCVSVCTRMCLCEAIMITALRFFPFHPPPCTQQRASLQHPCVLKLVTLDIQ